MKFYNNFSMFNEPNPYFSAGGADKKIAIGHFDTPYDNVKGGFFAATDTLIRQPVRGGTLDNFSAMAGKGKLCKMSGLSGADKKSCKKNIKATCGRKPLFGRAKKDAWSKCASSAVVSPEQQAQEMAEKLVPTTKQSGMGTGAIVMIGVAVVGTLALVGFAIVNRKKVQPVMQSAPVLSRV